MNVWWLALAVDWTSYREMKLRQVIAQGWRQLGDLRSLTRLASRAENEPIFEAVIGELAALAYGRKAPGLERPGKVIWKLFRAEPGDIFIALEGTTVKGLAELSAAAAATYRFEREFEYAQTIGYPVRWIDWDSARFDAPPMAPAQGVPGVVQMRAERERITAIWAQVQQE